MSPDLLKTFFERDLTPAEWDALGHDLESSPETAERFAAMMKEFNLGWGMPDPEKFSSGAEDILSALSPILKMLLPLLVVGASFWAAWKYRDIHPLVRPAAAPTPTEEPAAPAASEEAEPTPEPEKHAAQPARVEPTATWTLTRVPPKPTATFTPSATPSPTRPAPVLFKGGYHGQKMKE